MRNKIQHERTMKGITREELSIALFNRGNKISLATLQRYESNKTQPRIDDLSEIAKILKCSISDLIDRA